MNDEIKAQATTRGNNGVDRLLQLSRDELMAQAQVFSQQLMIQNREAYEALANR